MRFGGHETFAIREGWLHKGLKLLSEDRTRLVDEGAADWLGVGRNMAKSIKHWLLATGLASRTSEKVGKATILAPTDLGKVVWRHDPYFVDKATWWILHVNLVHTPEHATSWAWFFSNFNIDRFQKPVCVENLKRYIQLSKLRMPAIRTLDRDLSCLLASYARDLPAAQKDPEDVSECPFSELGLLVHYRSSGYYQLDRSPKDIPAHVLCYALAASPLGAGQTEGLADIPLRDATRAELSPGRVLVLSGESLFELASRAERELPAGDVQIAGLAGERVIRVRVKPASRWLEEYYLSINQRADDAA